MSDKIPPFQICEYCNWSNPTCSLNALNGHYTHCAYRINNRIKPRGNKRSITTAVSSSANISTITTKKQTHSRNNTAANEGDDGYQADIDFGANIQHNSGGDVQNLLNGDDEGRRLQREEGRRERELDEEKKDNNGEEQCLLVASILQHDFKLFPPSKLVLNHQERILDEYFSPVSFQAGGVSIRAPRNMKKNRDIKDDDDDDGDDGDDDDKVLSDGENVREPEHVVKGLLKADYIDIAHWNESIMCGKVSNEQGNSLLALINRILRRQNLDNSLMFPKCWRNLVNTVTKFSEAIHSVHQEPLPFPVTEWGKVDSDGFKLKIAVGHRRDVIEVLAERFLLCNPAKCQFFRSEEEVDDVNKIKSFFSGKFARNIEEIFRKLNEQERLRISKEEGVVFKRHVPIYLRYSEDGALMDKRRDGIPITIIILNLPVSKQDISPTSAAIDDNKYFPVGPELIAMHPGVPISDARLLSTQQKQMKCEHLGARKLRVRRLKTDMQFEFIQKVIQPAHDLCTIGVEMQVGLDADNSEIVIGHPVTSMFTGDNKMLNEWAGINSQEAGRKCRICNEKDCLRFCVQTKTWRCRNYEDMKRFSRGYAKIENKVYHDIIDRQRRQVDWKILTEEEKRIKTGKEVWNIVPRSNCFLFDVAADIKRTFGLDFFGFSCMTPPDELHTLLKGMVENVLGWTFNIFHMMAQINHVKYSLLVSSVDQMFIDFPFKQAITPVKLVSRLKGISMLFNEKRSRKASATQGTGMGTGGTPAWQLPGLAFTLLYSLGDQGNSYMGMTDNIVLPTAGVYSPHVTALLKRGLKKDWQVRTIILNALQSVLNVVYFSRKEEFTRPDLKELENLIQLSRAHMQQLWMMRGDLKGFIAKTELTNRKIKHFNGHKHHLLEHLPFEGIEMYGPSKGFDSQITEEKHKFVRGVFSKTSRNYESAFGEMFYRLARIIRIMFLKIADHIILETPTTKQDEKEGKEDDEKGNQDDVSFFSSSSSKSSSRDRSIQRIGTEVSRNIDDILEVHNDSLFSTFSVPQSCAKETLGLRIGIDDSVLFYVTSSSANNLINQSSSSNYVHPFIFRQLFTHLKNKIPEGRSRDLFKAFCKDQKRILSQEGERNRNTYVSIKVNARISSSGMANLGIPPFSIQCNSEVPRNAKTHSANKKVEQVFCACEVNFKDAEETSDGVGVANGMDNNVITLVRVFAIVTLTEYSTRDDKPISSRTVLVCAGLDDASRISGQKIRNSLVQYEYKKTGQNKGAQEIHVIDLTSVVRPACLIPVFDKDFPIDFKEQYSDQLKLLSFKSHWRHRRFYFVPIYTMHHFTVVDFIEQMQAAPTSAITSSSGVGSRANSDGLSLFLNTTELRTVERENGDGEGENIETDSDVQSSNENSGDDEADLN